MVVDSSQRIDASLKFLSYAKKKKKNNIKLQAGDQANIRYTDNILYLNRQYYFEAKFTFK